MITKRKILFEFEPNGTGKKIIRILNPGLKTESDEAIYTEQIEFLSKKQVDRMKQENAKKFAGLRREQDL